MTNSGFTGYSQETKKFFKQLGANNNKDWFQANRERYEQFVREPSKALVREMATRFATKGIPFIADEKKSMFRINRDIRFTTNKDPYKTNLGLNFPFGLSPKSFKPGETLGVYFHMDANESFVAGGIYMPPPNILKSLRNLIAEDWKELFKIVNQKNFKTQFPDIFDDDSLKTMPRGYPAGHPAAEWLRLKSLTVFCSLKHEETYTANLATILEKKAQVITQLFEFIQPAIDEAF